MGARLSARERDLYTILTNFSNHETADKLFQVGINSLSAVKQITSERVSKFLQTFNSIRSPLCPNPSPVFAGVGFEQVFDTFAEWMRYQPLIGLQPTASNWLRDPLASERTLARLHEMETADSDPTSGPTALPKLTSYAHFRRWEESFRQFLHFRYNKQCFPLSYVIRQKEREEVTDEQRSGTVGTDGMYSGWMEYNACCAALEGPQFVTDNQAVWVLLCNAVRDSPAWAYVDTYKKPGEPTGNARAAFLHIYDQAFSQTNVALILDKVCTGMHTSRYTGDSRNYDFEKHCRTWLTYQTILVTHDKFPDEHDFTMNFIHTIHDNRLDALKLQV